MLVDVLAVFVVAGVLATVVLMGLTMWHDKPMLGVYALVTAMATGMITLPYAVLAHG